MLAIYTRLSQQDETSNSISNQKREGKNFARRNKLPYKIYDEGAGISGTNEIQDRPQLDNLLKDIASKKITHVWFRNQNRLERNSNTFHVFASIAKKYKVKVYINDNLEDWDNPNSFLQSSILTAINEYQTSLQSYQTKKSLKDNAREGKSFGIYPYGYNSKDGFLVINKDEEETVRMIYKLSLSGMGTSSIAELLNDRQVPTRYRKIGVGKLTIKNKYTGAIKKIDKKDIKWSGNTVRGIIVNTIYKGKRKWGDEYYDAPALFSEDYWQKVNDNLKNNSNNKGKKVIHKYLLKGLMRCGKCGRNMYGRSRVSKKDHYYQCSSKRLKSCGNRSINIDKIEGIIWARFFKGDELLELLQKDILKEDNEIQELEKLIDSHLKRLSSHQKELDNLISLAIKGTFTDEQLLKHKKSIEYNIDKENKLIKDYKLQITNAKNSQQLIDNYVNEFDGYTENLTFLEKKEIINEYFEDIVVLSIPNTINQYLLSIKFKLNLKEELYFFSSKYNAIINLKSKKFILSKYFNENIEENYIEYSKKILQNIVIIPDGNVRSKPFYESGKNKIVFANNTIFPHGNMADWNLKKMISFYRKNPNWLCSKSGLSIISIDSTTENYDMITKKYKSFISKNNSIEDWLTQFIETKGFRE